MLACVAAGRFIVLEGVDGAGTTTQTRLLAQALQARGVLVHTTAEPSAGPIGVLLRRALSGTLVEADEQAPSWTTLALLFAADRLDHVQREIAPKLAAGVTVICDRYDHSTLAYQSVGGGGPEAIGWLRELNRHAPRPDVCFVLDVPAEVAAARRQARKGKPEIFDSGALQRRLGAFYAQLERWFAGEAIVHVDGTQPAATVTAAMAARLDALPPAP